MIGRYWRALIGALRLTLRGEIAPPPRSVERAAAAFPQMGAWLQTTLALLDTPALRAIDAHNVVIRIDKRDQSLATILGGVRFHAEQEYPHLLTGREAFALLAIQASNLNDHFAVTQAAHTPTLPADARAALTALADHLAARPTNIT